MSASRGDMDIYICKWCVGEATSVKLIVLDDKNANYFEFDIACVAPGWLFC
jgi:hypothetical protein